MAAAHMTPEIRQQLEDAALDYLHALDSLASVEAIASCFTTDAVIDLSALGMAIYDGHARVRDFAGEVIGAMRHSMHMLTNFRVTAFSGEAASCRAYACGMGRTKDGVTVKAYVSYELGLRLTPEGWRLHLLRATPQFPVEDGQEQ